ncbi:MAG: ion transporter, partial [Bacteroidota bacterium]
MLKKFFLSERMMLWAVVLNAVLIYAMYFPALKHKASLEYLDMVFLLLFLVEAIVKMFAYGIKGYFDDPWNRFDFIIVVASLPTLLVPFIVVPDTGFLIVLRLFRLVRIARLLRFVPNMNHVLSGLGRALKASVFVLAALLFLVFILAILTCHFYGEIVPQHFGDPLISIYSIFQMFTLEGWYEIP